MVLPTVPLVLNLRGIKIKCQTPTLPESSMETAVQPSRFVTIPLAKALTGYTVSAIETKIARGV